MNNLKTLQRPEGGSLEMTTNGYWLCENCGRAYSKSDARCFNCGCKEAEEITEEEMEEI